MSESNYARFLSECITRGPEKQPGIREDHLYGVYLSWCLLNAEESGSAESLWAALRQQGHRQHLTAGRKEWPELSMAGPAAVDYILSSQPSLL